VTQGLRGISGLVMPMLSNSCGDMLCLSYSLSTLSTTRITNATTRASAMNIGTQGASWAWSGSTGQTICSVTLSSTSGRYLKSPHQG
jgi:hypothetical protein